jgi:glucuronate isomerase
MTQPHPDRLFPADPSERALARELYAEVAGLPLVCPHGHVEAAILADDAPFPNPIDALVAPDHYVVRLLYSHGRFGPEELELLRRPERTEVEARHLWRLVASSWALLRGTPTRLWLEQELDDLFGLSQTLSGDNADATYDRIAECLASPQLRPRALFARFGIETLATTDSPLASLDAHARIDASDLGGRVIPTFRPDELVDLEAPSWPVDVARLGELAGEDTGSYPGFVAALEDRRRFFATRGATATDHGHPSALTLDLGHEEAARLYTRALAGRAGSDDAERFRAHMLTEFARMSLEDGLVMQLHPGSLRNHNRALYRRLGPDIGADIPQPTDYVHALRPLLDRFGNDLRLTLVVFTLDESTYSRELAPLAGHYPALRLGPAWWFNDSPDGMRRFRELTTETAGFYNTVGFNDDARAFPSIPARHDAARRVDCAFLARLVAEHRLPLQEARETAIDLAYRLPREAYRLEAGSARRPAGA